MFGTSWDLSTLGAYNTDLNDRLARKKSKYRDRSQQLDLVIVVDRLLTGFDAPCLSTIFLDRPPMKLSISFSFFAHEPHLQQGQALRSNRYAPNAGTLCGKDR